MPNRSKSWSHAAILLSFFLMLLSGCAGGQTGQQTDSQAAALVSPLYMLTTAGFQKWEVNLQTPKRQALLDSIPYGKIMTYVIDGTVYHVYADKDSNTLYVGDAAAYQKYLVMSTGKQLCERVEGQNQQTFWRCFVEFQQVGPTPGGN
jgi:hypothetical protein